MKDLSNKNAFRLPKNRRLELEHYCRQYHAVKGRIIFLRGRISAKSYAEASSGRNREWSDKTGESAVELTRFEARIRPIERAIDMLDESVQYCVLENVTNGTSYDAMNAKHPMPVSRHEFYAEVRRFFYILSELRN